MQIYPHTQKLETDQAGEVLMAQGHGISPGSSVLLVLLDELGVLEVLLGEVGCHLGDEEAGDGEPGEEGPVALPLTAEEHRPRVERLHLRLRILAISFLLRLRVLLEMDCWRMESWRLLVAATCC